MGIIVKGFFTCKDMQKNEDNTVNFISVFTKLVVDPNETYNFNLICMFDVDLEEDTIVKLYSLEPNEEESASSVDIEIKARKHPYVLNCEVNLECYFESEGKHVFIMEHDDKLIALHDILIQFEGR
ncbi:hypothetical protein [Brevibacillus laterosporus]|uniref:hypothetical protein n=1 Tax=Brevibacillus laterosporus TaxID=1465 RepID=UPI000B9B6103|nr:hypothetical protein [Brevibacillus laterosporus]